MLQYAQTNKVAQCIKFQPWKYSSIIVSSIHVNQGAITEYRHTAFVPDLNYFIAYW